MNPFGLEIFSSFFFVDFNEGLGPHVEQNRTSFINGIESSLSIRRRLRSTEEKKNDFYMKINRIYLYKNYYRLLLLRIVIEKFLQSIHD